jgi:hypothetical protein
MIRDVLALAVVAVQVSVLILLLELVIGWWRVRRALDDLHELLRPGDEDPGLDP